MGDTPLFNVGDRVVTSEITFKVILRVYDAVTCVWRIYGETLEDTCRHTRNLKSTDVEPPHPLILAGWEKVSLSPQQLLEVSQK